MFFKSTKLGSINGVFELSAGAGWIRLHGTDCKEKLNMVEHHTDERVKGLIDWFKSLPMPFLISVTSWVGVELSVLHRLMFRLSHFRMCHESLLGKSCSALWSLAVTHNTVSRFMCCRLWNVLIRCLAVCDLTCPFDWTGKAHILEVLNALYHELAACEVLSVAEAPEQTQSDQSVNALVITC